MNENKNVTCSGCFTLVRWTVKGLDLSVRQALGTRNVRNEPYGDSRDHVHVCTEHPSNATEHHGFAVPESITEHYRELYAEYIKPEQFFRWVYEQEYLKRKLAEQQQQFELEHQQCLARAELFEFRKGWELGGFSG